MRIIIICFIFNIIVYSNKTEKSLNLHQVIVNKGFYQRRRYYNSSKLGAVLFKNEDLPSISPQKRNRTFVILIWQRWEIFQNRHVYYYGKTRHDPLEGCSVSNCVFTGDDSLLNTAEAVVVYLQEGLWPRVAHRNRTQRWIFLSDESPINAFAGTFRRIKYENLQNIFNWSMTYETDKNLKLHEFIVNKIYYQRRRYYNTSKLGAVLFKNEDYPLISPQKRNRTFIILIWQRWEIFESRHVYYFGGTRHDPLEGCSVSNCVFTGDDSLLNTAEAVVVFLQEGLWPRVSHRNRTQRWIFLNEEPPRLAFAQACNRIINYEDLHNMFNWSMTYESGSDVPVPYGRTVPLPAPLFSFKNLSLAKIVPNWKVKQADPLVAILFSHCVPYRLKLVAELRKYIKVDAYGKCGQKKFRNSCPGHVKSECKVLAKYVFYLALENSKCKEYMTEKLFYNAYYQGAIPIIQGPTKEECKTFLPPHSYLHVDDYATPKDLANDIMRIGKDNNKLFNYHWWRNHFKVVNEHGFFGSKSFHLCRVCEAMNYNDDTESVYSKTDLARFFDESLLCRKY